MDLLDETLNALNIKVSPTFADIAERMPPSVNMVDTQTKDVQGGVTDGNSK